MLEVTLTEVQTYLWLSIWVDTQQQAILDWINEKVLSNVWDISQWEKTMRVKNSQVQDNTITLDIIKPTDITEINWNDFSSKSKWTDYIINEDWNAKIINLCNYISNDFWFFDVKFNAWYTETPKTLISVVSNYFWYLYSQDTWKDILEEKLWPRWVKFEWDNINWESKALKDFRQWLKKFIPLALRYY